MRLKLLLLAVLACGTAARADIWSKHYAVAGGDARLYLKAGDGNVRVTSSDTPEIVVRVVTEGYRLSQEEVQVEEIQSGSEVRINVRVPHRVRFCIGYCYRRIDIDVTVPRRVNLEVRTDDGHIAVNHVAGELRLHTGDGNMELHALDGTLLASSGDGHITADGRFDNLDLSSGDGRIEAEALRGSRIAGTWRLRSGDGSILLRLPEDFGAELEATTGDGAVNVDFPITTTGRIRESRIRGRLNGGGGFLDLHTGDGSIRVARL